MVEYRSCSWFYRRLNILRPHYLPLMLSVWSASFVCEYFYRFVARAKVSVHPWLFSLPWLLSALWTFSKYVYFDPTYVNLAFLAAFWCLQIPKQKLPNRAMRGWPTGVRFIFEATCLSYGRSLSILFPWKVWARTKGCWAAMRQLCFTCLHSSRSSALKFVFLKPRLFLSSDGGWSKTQGICYLKNDCYMIMVWRR